MLPARLRWSLYAVHAVAAATLVRSILYDRWITVFASLLLIAGAAAARRNRAWGLGVAFGASAAFPAAFALGIAPAWFCLVGLVGALPFALMAKHFARRDAAATLFGAGLASGLGALGALGWLLAAPFLFDNVPALRPSLEAGNGGLAALAAVAAVWLVAGKPGGRARVDATSDAQVRVALSEASPHALEADEQADEVAVASAARRAAGR